MATFLRNAQAIRIQRTMAIGHGGNVRKTKEQWKTDIADLSCPLKLLVCPRSVNCSKNAMPYPRYVNIRVVWSITCGFLILYCTTKVQYSIYSTLAIQFSDQLYARNTVLRSIVRVHKDWSYIHTTQDTQPGLLLSLFKKEVGQR